MNMLRAESAALNGMMRNATFTRAFQLCDHVKAYPFHSGAVSKMHRTEVYVEHEMSQLPDCGGVLGECI